MHRYYKIAAVALAILALALLTLLPGSPVRTLLFNTLLTIERTPIETRRPNRDVMKIGHRGTTIFAPENTLPALEKAIELGLEYVEIDVRFTKDSVPVLMHDRTVDRTTNGSGKVSEFTLSELKQLDAGFWFEDEFIGTRVPTLEETLQVAQGRVCLYWDTKVPAADATMKFTIELFRRYGFDRDCLLITFGGLGSGNDPTTPRQIVKFWPYAPLTPTVKDPLEIAAVLTDFPNIRAVFIARFKLTPELVDEAHAQGLLVLTHALAGADRARFYQRLIEAGVDIFMLDYIDSFYTYLETGNIDTPIPPAPKNSRYTFN